MSRVRPNPAAIRAAFERRDRLARQLEELDRAITLAGREWSREQGNIVPLRTEALRRAVQPLPDAEAS